MEWGDGVGTGTIQETDVRDTGGATGLETEFRSQRREEDSLNSSNTVEQICQFQF